MPTFSSVNDKIEILTSFYEKLAKELTSKDPLDLSANEFTKYTTGTKNHDGVGTRVSAAIDTQLSKIVSDAYDSVRKERKTQKKKCSEHLDDWLERLTTNLILGWYGDVYGNIVRQKDESFTWTPNKFNWEELFIKNLFCYDVLGGDTGADIAGHLIVPERKKFRKEVTQNGDYKTAHQSLTDALTKWCRKAHSKVDNVMKALFSAATTANNNTSATNDTQKPSQPQTRRRRRLP